MEWPALREISGAQDGLFTADQARACGYTDKMIRRRLSTGEWQPVAGRVFAVGGCPITATMVDRALGLAIPDAVLTGASAARVHGISTVLTGCCALTGSRARFDHPGVRLLREPVATRDVTMRRGLLVATPARTVFDLLRTSPPAAAEELLDTALQRRWLTVAELSSRVTAHVGRRDAPALVALVRHAASGTQSTAERLAVRLFRRARITGWAANGEIRNARGTLIACGDLVFPESRLVVEIDGRAHHVTPAQFQRDRERQNKLVAAGWTVLRFTWADLTRQPERVVQMVRRQIT